MGFWSDLLALLNPRRVTDQRVYFRSPDAGVPLSQALGSPAVLWRTQPHLRTVIGFRARNVAQLGLHVYRRRDDGGRERDRTSELSKALRYADGTMTTYELIYSLVGDHDLHDRAYWLVAKSASTPSGWTLRRLPPVCVEEVWRNPFELSHYQVQLGGHRVDLAPNQVLAFPGFDPTAVSGSSPTVEALRELLEEQIESSRYRGQLWKRGGRVSSVLERPVDAEPWSDAAREAFRQDWYAKYTGNGPMAGGTPILEDGMTLKRIDFSAQDQQFVEAARLSLETVAAAFHVEPSMVGMGGGQSYANMRAFRKMLYTETLGPLLRSIEARINTFLIPMLGEDPEQVYVEFNVEEKLRGDFEEQASVLSTSTGRPWMTANEARARQNLPALPGGDELVIPLNVLAGGQAAPTDSGSQNEVPDPLEEDRPKLTPSRLHMKARPSQPEIDKHVEELQRFFSRQSKAVLDAIAEGGRWWDAEHWDADLQHVLFRLSVMASTSAGRAALRRAGLDPENYGVDRTEAFLSEASARNASNINEATRAALEDPDADPSHVFEVAREARAVQAGATLATFAAGFGSVEAARQNSTRATKTWVVTSSNPRPEHAAIDGETVPVDQDFSNGLPWPGAAGADVDEVAGCTCDMIIRF